jgi:hypothetical protein
MSGGRANVICKRLWSLGKVIFIIHSEIQAPRDLFGV